MRVVAVLYESFSPVYGLTKKRTNLKESFGVDKNGCTKFRWRETLAMSRARLDATTNIVLELHAAGKEAAGGGATDESIMGWAFVPALSPSLIPVSGLQIAPVYSLPLMPAAERKTQLGGTALIEFRLSVRDDDPGVEENQSNDVPYIEARKMDEDIQGVPTSAWRMVRHAQINNTPYQWYDQIYVIES